MDGRLGGGSRSSDSGARGEAVRSLGAGIARSRTRARLSIPAWSADRAEDVRVERERTGLLAMVGNLSHSWLEARGERHSARSTRIRVSGWGALRRDLRSDQGHPPQHACDRPFVPTTEAQGRPRTCPPRGVHHATPRPSVVDPRTDITSVQRKQPASAWTIGALQQRVACQGLGRRAHRTPVVLRALPARSRSPPVSPPSALAHDDPFPRVELTVSSFPL